MPVYAIGDVQGCYGALRRLLDKLDFDEHRDQVWFTGDLVNRGPASLKTLRFVKQLGDSAVTVLGNHDMHLLAAYLTGNQRSNRDDTLDEVLEAKDCDELMHWLRHRPFMHHDKTINSVMVHAGLPPQWTVRKSARQARKLEKILQGGRAAKLLANMYTAVPRLPDTELSKWQRRQYALAVFTRMRYIHPKGRLEMTQKGVPGQQKAPFIPWFDAKRPRWQDQARIVFGHWSTLGRLHRDDVISLDGGCVWGGCLLAAQLTKKRKVKYTQVDCKSGATIKKLSR